MLFTAEGQRTRLLPGNQLTFCMEGKCQVLRIVDERGLAYTRDSADHCDVSFIYATGLKVFVPLLKELLGISLDAIKSPAGIECFQVARATDTASILVPDDQINWNETTHELKHSRGEPGALVKWNDDKGKKLVWFLDDLRSFTKFAELLADFADMSVEVTKATPKTKPALFNAHFTAR